MNKVLQVIVWAILILARPVHAQTLDALLNAVAEDNIPGAVFYLDRGMEPDTTDKDGNTLLMIASRHGYMDMATMLLERRANVSRQSPAGDTALLMASLGGHLELVKLLVQAGAPIKTPDGWQPIQYAAFSGATDIVAYCLDQGADKDSPAPGNELTPLMLAVRNGHGDTAKFLIAHGADISRHSSAGITALMLAERTGDTALIALLKQAGAAE